MAKNNLNNYLEVKKKKKAIWVGGVRWGRASKVNKEAVQLELAHPYSFGMTKLKAGQGRDHCLNVPLHSSLPPRHIFFFLLLYKVFFCFIFI